MFKSLIHGFYWGAEWNVERFVQSATGTRKCIPFRVRAGRAVEDGKASPSAHRARYRLSWTGSPRGNGAGRPTKFVAVERHEYQCPSKAISTWLATPKP